MAARLGLSAFSRAGLRPVRKEDMDETIAAVLAVAAASPGGDELCERLGCVGR